MSSLQNLNYQHYYVKSFFFDLRLPLFPCFNFISGVQWCFLIYPNKSNRFVFLLFMILFNHFSGNSVKFLYFPRMMRKRFLKIGFFNMVKKQKMYFLLVIFFLQHFVSIYYKKDFSEQFYAYYSKFYLDSFDLNFYFYMLLEFHHNIGFVDFTSLEDFVFLSYYKITLKVCTLFKFLLLNRLMLFFTGNNLI